MAMEEQAVTLLETFAQFVAANGRQFVIASAVGAALEVLLPGERHSLKSRFKGALYIAVFICIGMWMGMLATSGLGKLHIGPLLNIDLSAIQHSGNVAVRILGFAALPLAGIFIGDFFYYWFHRMQHAVPALWRFHRVHHSIRELNAINNFNHISEDFLRAIFVVLPSVILLRVEMQQIFLLSAYVAVIGQVSHANTRARFWPLGYFLVEPAYHRLHHSLEARHIDKNFASILPFLDVVFGTAYFPKRGEHPKTGLDELPEPDTLKEYLLPPPVRQFRGVSRDFKS